MAYFRKKAMQYTGSLLFGGLMENIGRKYSEHNPQQKREYHSQQGQQYGNQLDRSMQKPFDQHYWQSFDTRQWQLPKFGADMWKTGQYAWKTTTAQKREDMGEALKQSAKNAVQELVNDPFKQMRQTVAKAQKAKGQYDAFQQDGDTLQQHSKDLTTQKSMEMARSLGRNSMLKAPGYLMPGVFGMAYRSFFTAKMIGNFGAQYNELRETHDKMPSTMKQQRDQRLASMNKGGQQQ